MRPSLWRWLDWAMNNVFPDARPRPHGHPVHVRYEAAGLTLAGPPVPWTATAVVVELVLRLPPAARQRTDFTLRVPGRGPVPAEAVRRDEADERTHRVVFRFPPPAATATAEVLWKHRLLAAVPLPVQTADEFRAGLRVGAPTVAVRLGDRSVAARTFVAAQCRGLTAAAVVRSPTGLAPLADLGLEVVLRADRTGTEQAVGVPPAASQLAAKETLVAASFPKFPRRAGDYAVVWRAGGHDLLTHRLTAVTGVRFAGGLRVADARFVVADGPGGVQTVRQPPAPGSAARVGPCFVVASREVGAAGLVDLEVVAQVPGAVRPPVLFAQTVLVTDGPAVVAPGLVDPAEVAQLSGFELRHKGRVLGVLSFRPVPMAAFDAEGAFQPPPDFAWSPAAEDELSERLLKLMRGP